MDERPVISSQETNWRQGRVKITPLGGIELGSLVTWVAYEVGS